MKYKIGDSVKVKPNVVVDDFKKIDFTNWQGRVVECFEETELEVAWDSITLRQLPEAYILKNIKEDYNFDSLILETNQVEKTVARDEENDRLAVLQTLENKHYGFDDVGNDNDFYKDLFESKNTKVTPRNLNIYLEYIEECIEMPCLMRNTATKETFQLFSFLGNEIEKNNAILVKAIRQSDKKQLILPLQDLLPVDETSDNYSILKPFVTWFLDNREKN